MTPFQAQAEEKEARTEYSYYPGCSLYGTALEYHTSVNAVAGILNITLLELPDWNCCGASSAHMTDHELAHTLAARVVRIAEKEGRDVVIPCAACFQRLKAAQKRLQEEEARRRGSRPEGIRLYHLSELFQRLDILALLRKAVKRPLEGLLLAPYYGCLITRPPSITGSKEHEDPQGMDRLIHVLGGRCVRWSYKTECCGGSLAMPRPDITRALVSRIVRAAADAGAQGIVTMCPMCQANLDSRQSDLARQDRDHPLLPVFFATELADFCTREDPGSLSWKRHFIDPTPAVGSLLHSSQAG
jgi:heterodisulfide reductase subunit B